MPLARFSPAQFQWKEVKLIIDLPGQVVLILEIFFSSFHVESVSSSQDE
jgi:hypothetical protein